MKKYEVMVKETTYKVYEVEVSEKLEESFKEMGMGVEVLMSDMVGGMEKGVKLDHKFMTSFEVTSIKEKEEVSV
jgi:hypothetical protein